MSWQSVMQKRASIKSDTLVVGIDIGKRSHVARAILPDTTIAKPLHFENNRAGFEKLQGYVVNWQRAALCSETVVGMESTGHYCENLAYWLAGRGTKVVQVNALHVKRTKETFDNSPGKADPKDAALVADLVSQGKYLGLILPQGDIAELRQLVNLRQRLVTERTAKLNLLHAALDRVFPEFTTVFKDPLGKTARYILGHFPLPAELLRFSAIELWKQLQEKCDKRLSLKKVEGLLAAAAGSVGVVAGSSGARLALCEALAMVQYLADMIGRLEDSIAVLVAKVEESRWLMSLRGIGLITAAVILAETGGLKCYDRAASVLKLAGINLYEISSGQSHGLRRISRRGRSLLRHILYLAALQQTHRGAPLYEFYTRLVEKGKPKVKALIAVACKLVRVLFALVRDGRCYVARPRCPEATESIA